MSQPNQYLEQFHHIPDAGLYEESSPYYFDTRLKQKHGVLLIHGFSASTYEFRYLMQLLKTDNIPFYTPMLSGFGIDNTKSLRHISSKDWLRDAMNAYTLLQNTCDEVSIVAHSMGCNLAIYLSQIYPVKKLILSAPYIIEKSSHKFLKKILLTPVLSQIMCFLNSSVKKNNKEDLEKIRKSGRFVYTKVPIQSVKALWSLIGKINLKVLHYKELHILCGKNDGTIEIESVLEKFRQNDHIYKFYSFEHSGHNILEDIEQTEVNATILKILQ